MTTTAASFATSFLVLTAALPAFAAVELPRGDPPQPAARRINVADFGPSLADDEHDDTPAVSAAIKAATNNSTLYFPAGTYNVKWVGEMKDFDGLSLQGDGPDKSIIRRMGPFWKAGDAPTWENLRANYATDAKLLGKSVTRRSSEPRRSMVAACPRSAGSARVPR